MWAQSASFGHTLLKKVLPIAISAALVAKQDCDGNPTLHERIPCLPEMCRKRRTENGGTEGDGIACIAWGVCRRRFEVIRCQRIDSSENMNPDLRFAFRKTRSLRSDPLQPDQAPQFSCDSLGDAFLRDLPVNKLSFPLLYQALTFLKNIPLPRVNWHYLFALTKIVPESFHCTQLLLKGHLVDLECCRHELILTVPKRLTIFV